MYNKRQYKRDRVLAFMVMVIFFLGSFLLNGFENSIKASSEVTSDRISDFQAVDDKVYVREVQSVKTKPIYKWVTVSGYCHCKICCGKNAKGITANGEKVKTGMIAASRGTPFGTRIKIKGRVYVVTDRLAKRFDKRIDIYFNSHKQALKFGVQRLKVEVLN